MAQTAPRRSSILWHPHQGFWNHRLIDALKRFVPWPGIRRVVGFGIVAIDSACMAVRAIWRRVRTTGVQSLFARPRIPADVQLLHLDLGLHEQGAELAHVLDVLAPALGVPVRAYGFEASGASYAKAAPRFAGRDDVTVMHRAVCGTLPEGGTLRLFLDDGDGLGDSLYRESERWEDVPAITLSAFMDEVGGDPARTITFVRMNIEGAEFDVVRDLIDSGRAERVDAWLGMWDDLSKIDQAKDAEFREMAARAGIRRFPFNGRDLRWRLRRWCILYEVRTRVLVALRRMTSG